MFISNKTTFLRYVFRIHSSETYYGNISKSILIHVYLISENVYTSSDSAKLTYLFNLSENAIFYGKRKKHCYTSRTIHVMVTYPMN